MAFFLLVIYRAKIGIQRINSSSINGLRCLFGFFFLFENWNDSLGKFVDSFAINVINYGNLEKKYEVNKDKQINPHLGFCSRLESSYLKITKNSFSN